MSSEWPHSVQDVAHYSIQDSDVDNTYQYSSNEENIPLLREGGNYCVRNTWITFFVTFLFVGLITGTYLLITEATEWPITESYYSLISREGWKAKRSDLNITMPVLQLPLDKVLLTETNSPGCVTEEECSKKVSEMQNDHVSRLQEPDIVYNFLIAGDGQTYEGRGWKYQALVSNDNTNRTLVVAFLGIFNYTLPSKKQIDQAKSFLQVAESKGKLSECYSIEREKRNENKTGEIFNYVVSHLRSYFNKTHNQCKNIF